MVTGCPQMPSRWVGFLQGPSTNEYTIYVKARVATGVILGVRDDTQGWKLEKHVGGFWGRIFAKPSGETGKNDPKTWWKSTQEGWNPQGTFLDLAVTCSYHRHGFAFDLCFFKFFLGGEITSTHMILYFSDPNFETYHFWMVTWILRLEVGF